MNDVEILLKGLPADRLNDEQETMLAKNARLKRLASSVRQQAKQMLVLHSMREAFFYAMKCCRRKLSNDEIYSLCYDALCKSSENFKPGFVRFFAYSKVYVRSAICKAWKQKDVVKNSSSHESLVMDEDLFHSDDLPPALLAMHHSTLNSKKISDDFEDPDFDTIHTRELWELVKPFLNSRLTERERQVLRMKYFHGKNFEEIGAHFKVTREAVRGSHKKAMKKLRSVLASKPELFNV